MPPRLSRYVGRLAVAIVLLTAFYGLDRTDVGTHISFGGTWTSTSPGQLYLWLGLTFLVLPAFLLVGTVVAAATSTSGAQRVLDRLPRRLPRPLARLGWWWSIPCGLAATLVYGLGHHYIRGGYPFTDDQWAVRFGGELMAKGQLTTAAPDHLELLPNLYLYLRDGRLTSFDWPGAIATWGVADATGLGPWFYAALSGVTVVAVAIFVGRRLGRRWAAAATLLWFASPMALSLSVTTHTHVASRAGIAVAYAAWAAARDASGRASIVGWLVFGAAAGAAGLTRPIETAALVGPLFVFEAWRAVRGQSDRRGFAVAAAVVAAAIALFVLHSYLVTGTLLPARLAGNNELVFPGRDHYRPALSFLTDSELFWERVGANLGYNLMMLAVYGLGIVGPLLAFFGVRDETDRVLLVGLVAAFAVAMLHDDHGLHIVGPIHYSEALIPLFFLALSGLAHLAERLEGPESRTADSRTLVVAVVIGTVGWGALFSVEHLGAMRRESELHRQIDAFVDRPEHQDAILFVPQYGEVWRQLERTTESYVFDWPKEVDPSGPIVAIWRPSARKSYVSLLEAHPDRRVLRLTLHTETPFIRIKSLDRDRLLREIRNRGGR